MRKDNVAKEKQQKEAARALEQIEAVSDFLLSRKRQLLFLVSRVIHE